MDMNTLSYHKQFPSLSRQKRGREPERAEGGVPHNKKPPDYKVFESHKNGFCIHKTTFFW